MGRTNIEWTEFSINPIRARLNGRTGHYCEKVSTGCKNCYSSRLQARFGMPQFQKQRGETETFLDTAKLEEVLRRRKPTKFFWCDMTDMFGEWVPNEWIAACFGVMAATPHHVHQVLTKRPQRALEWFDEVSGGSPLDRCAVAADDVLEELLSRRQRAMAFASGKGSCTWPLPNVWLGVSAENQKTADERIPLLLRCPAAIRFVSAEPLLGPIDLRYVQPSDPPTEINALSGTHGVLRPHQGTCEKLDWVIVGSESGPRARPMPIWQAESLRMQCEIYNVAFFTKQIANEHDRKGGDPQYWSGGPEAWPREFPA